MSDKKSYCSISEPVKEICKQLQENGSLDNDNAIVVNEKLIFQKGDFVVLGSRPGIGKTAFAISLTRRLSVEQNIPTGFISPETNKHHISLRFLSQITEVEYKKIKYRKLSKNDISKIIKASEILTKSPIYINDEQLISLENIKRTIIGFSNQNVKIVFIDCLGLIKDLGVLCYEYYEITDEYASRVEYILHSLKQLASDLNIVIILLVQIARSPSGAAPSIRSFLGTSLIVKENADKVLLLHRDRLPNKEEQTYHLEITDYKKWIFSEIDSYFSTKYLSFEI